MGNAPPGHWADLSASLLLDNLHDVVVVFDEHLVMQWATPSIERLTGAGLDHHLGTDALESIHPDDFGGVLEAVTAMRDHGSPRARVTFRLGHADGTFRWVEAEAKNCFADARVAGIVATLRDVTELKEIEQRQARFVSTVAHELRTPLTVIKGLTHLAVKQLADADPDVLEMLTRVEANSVRLSAMIDQLLAVSRLRASDVELEFEDLDVAEVVDQSVDILGTDLEDRLVRTDEVEGLIVRADRAGLEHVIRNFVSNAAKFGPKGSMITVTGHRSGDHVEIHVCDEGPGVDPEHREGIFQEFGQTDDGKRAGGSGLGLSIARRYVELHGGEIGVDQAPGGGARFWFRIPA